MVKRIILCLSLAFAVACGSDDGSTAKKLNWTTTNLETNFNIRGITCGDNGSVVAVGSGGRAATSDNGGNSWMPARRVAGLVDHLNGITYCNNKFIIVGDNYTVLHSADQGESWSPVSTTPFQEISYKAAACNGSNFLLGGKTKLDIGDSNFDNRTAYSIDNGLTWNSYRVSGAIPDNSTYIGVNLLMYSGGNYFMATDGGLSGYSNNGITWNTLLTPVDRNFNFTGMAQGTDNGTKLTLFSAVTPGDNATGRLVVYYNDNITQWTDAALPAGNAPVRGVAYGKDVFVALTDNRSYVTDNHTYILNDNYTMSWQEDNYPEVIRDFKINTVTYCGGAFWVGTNTGQIFRAQYR